MVDYFNFLSNLVDDQVLSGIDVCPIEKEGINKEETQHKDLNAEVELEHILDNFLLICEIYALFSMLLVCFFIIQQPLLFIDGVLINIFFNIWVFGATCCLMTRCSLICHY